MTRCTRTLRHQCIPPIAAPEQGSYDAIILAVGHDQFRQLGGQGVRAFGKPQAVVYDVKHVQKRGRRELNMLNPLRPLFAPNLSFGYP